MIGFAVLVFAMVFLLLILAVWPEKKPRHPEIELVSGSMLSYPWNWKREETEKYVGLSNIDTDMLVVIQGNDVNLDGVVYKDSYPTLRRGYLAWLNYELNCDKYDDTD